MTSARRRAFYFGSSGNDEGGEVDGAKRGRRNKQVCVHGGGTVYDAAQCVAEANVLWGKGVTYCVVLCEHSLYSREMGFKDVQSFREKLTVSEEIFYVGCMYTKV